MIINDVAAQHLGGGVVVFKDAITIDFEYAVNLAEEIVAREKNQMYKPATHPETGKAVYINKSQYYFDTEIIDRMPRRGSEMHQDGRPDVIELVNFLEQSKDFYLLKYLELFPIALKNIWWKVKGHLVSYQPGVFLGSHSDTSADYVYGIDEPADQLATRNTISCLVYLNDQVDSDNELNEHNFTGGEHYFNYLDITVNPKHGDILFFPSNYMAAHEVLPVKNGIRYSYLGWYSHGTPNPDVGEYVTDPIKEPELAQISTNLYMPTLQDDFRKYIAKTGNTSVSIPGFRFDYE